MRTLWQQLKIVVEASAAVPYAAVQEQLLDISGARVGIIVTGGNVDLAKFSDLIAAAPAVR